MKKKSFIYIGLKLFRISFTAAPIHYSIYIIFVILNGLSSAFLTLALQKFFDEIEFGMKENVITSGVIAMLILLGVVIIGSHIINGIDNFLSEALGEKVKKKYAEKVIKKSTQLDPVLFESHEFLDKINKAHNGMNSAYYFLGVSMVILIYYLPYVIFMSVYLFNLKPMLVLMLLLAFIPTMLSQIIRTGIFSKMEDKVAPIRRTYGHYTDAICGASYFKETRLLGIFEFLKRKLMSTILRLQKVTWDAQKKSRRLEAITKALTLLGYGGVLILLVYSVLKQDISIGAFAAVFVSIGTMFDTMNEAICIHINNASHSLGSVRNFVDFIEYPTVERSARKIAHNERILAKNITFQYPESDYKTLDDVNLNIYPGETIAIVGENGSGKTTLGRILIGLFNPTEGQILFGDNNLSDINRHVIFEGISAVFQKYQKYQLTLLDNVYISDTTLDKDEKNVNNALEKSGLNIKAQSFPDGLHTMLSRELDGVEISGGQWQRVAIARGYHRDHEIILLDEPTAAIDPIEESNIYRQFAELSRDRTTILITHRLASTKLADRIFVLSKGKVIESGTHQELMNHNKIYAKMYQAQSQWYE